MKTLVVNVLDKVLNDWLEEMDPDSLVGAIYTGNVQLGPVKIRREAFDRLGLPFILRQGSATRITLQIQWNSFGKTPIRLEIEGVSLYVAPRSKAFWSPSTALKNLDLTKTAQLSSFELFSMASQTQDSSEVLSSLLRRVMSNLQVTISGVYIRYEDQESANQAFSVGIILHRFEAFSCNREWIKSFSAESDVIYKKVTIDRLSVFLDYGSDCKAALELGVEDSDEQEFKRFAKAETDQLFPFPHKFLLNPIRITADFEINQNIRNKAIPQTAVNIVLGDREYPLKCAVETAQVTLVTNMLTYWQEFDFFQTGVLLETPFHQFTPEEGQAYRSLYLKYRQCQDIGHNKEAEEIYPTLQPYEIGHSYEEIVSMRKAAQMEAKLNQEERLSEAKLASLKNPVKEGKLAKMKFLIGMGESLVEKSIKEEQRKREMEAVIAEIEGIKKRQMRVVEEVRAFAHVKDPGSGEETEGSFVKVAVMLRVPEYTFTFLTPSQPLIELWLSQFVIEISLPSTSGFSLKLQLSKFLLRDFVSQSGLFPHIVETGRLQVIVDKTGTEVTRITVPHCDQMTVVASVDTVETVVRQWNEATSHQTPCSPLNSRIDHYLALGKSQPAPCVPSASPYHSYDLNLDLTSPCLFLPFSLTSPNDIFAIDLGKLKISTLLAKQAKSLPSKSLFPLSSYDLTAIELENMTINTLNRLENITKWKKCSLETVLKPVKLGITLQRCVESRNSLPELVIETDFSAMAVLLSNPQIALISRLYSHYSDVFSSISGFLPAFPVDFPSSYHLHMQMANFSLSFLLSPTSVFHLQLISFHVISASTFNGNRITDLRISTITIEDVHNDTQWRRIAGKVSSGKNEEEKLIRWTEIEKNIDKILENEEEKTLFLQNANRDLSLDFHVFTVKNEQEKTFSMSLFLDHFRVVLNPLTLKVTQFLSSFLPKVPIPHFHSDLTQFKIVLFFSRIDLWIPLDSSSQVSRAVYLYTEFGYIFTSTANTEESAVLDVVKIGGKIGSVRDGEIIGIEGKNDLLQAVRLSGEYEKRGEEGKTEVNVEGGELVLGVRDCLFLKDLYTKLLPHLPSPLPLPSSPSSPLSLSFKCDQFSILIYDDLPPRTTPFLKLCTSNLSFTCSFQGSELRMLLAGAVELLYHHPTLFLWEPMIEYWPFIVSIQPEQGVAGGSQGKRRLEFQEICVNSCEIHAAHHKDESVRVNVTFGMLERCLRLWRKTADWKEKDEAVLTRTVSVLYAGVKVKNKTGVPFEVWLEGKNAENQTHLQLDPGRSQMLMPVEDGNQSCLLSPPFLPVRLGLQIYKLPIRGIAIGATGRYSYGRGAKDLSGLFVEVKTRPQGTVVSIESKLKIINRSNLPITIERDSEQRSIPPNSMQTLPTTWLSTPSPLYLQTLGGILVPLLTTTGPIRLDREYTVMLDHCWVSKTAGGRKQTYLQMIILLNPPLTVVNSFPAVLKVTHVSTGIETTLEPGGEACLYHVSGTREGNCFRWKVCMKVSESETKAEMLSWDSSTSHYDISGELPGEKITLQTVMGYRGSRTWGNTEGELIDEQFGGLLVYVYSQYWVVNHTDYILEFAGKKKSLTIPARCSGMVKYNKPTLKMRVQDSKNSILSDWSNDFNITSKGVAGLLVVQAPAKEGTETKVERHFGVLVTAGTWPVTKSTILHIYPRYLISSTLPFPIFLKQSQGTKALEISPNQSYSFQYENGMFEKHVQIGMEGNWSSSFSLDEIETFQVRFKNTQMTTGSEWWRPSRANDFHLFTSVSISTDNQAVIFIHFSIPSEPEIEIRNETSSVVLMRQEGCTSETSQRVFPGQTTAYAYTNHLPTLKRVELSIPSHCQFYSFDKLKTFKTLLGRIEVSVEPNGNTRLVYLREYLDFGYRPAVSVLIPVERQKYCWNLALFLPKLELSLHDGSQKEVLLTSISDLFLYYHYRQGDKDEVMYMKRTLGGNIGKVQVDDMRAGKSEWPVVFGCRETQGDTVPFAQMQVVIDQVQRRGSQGEVKIFTRVEYVAVQLQEMFLNLQQSFLLKVLQIVVQVKQLFQPTQTGTSLNLQPSDPVRPEPHFAQKTFYQSLNLAAMKVTIALKASPSSSTALHMLDDVGQLGQLARYTSTIQDVTEASLGFSSIIVVNSFQTLGSVLGVIKQEYTGQGILQFYKLLGSSDLLLNPLGLIDKLGTGVFEFFSLPIKGLMKSPQDFTQGIGKGVKSLVNGVLSEGVGTVSKVTGSLYTLMRKVGGDTGTADLTTDNMVMGLYKGVTGTVEELTEGVTGVFVKPWKGAQSGGVSGFLKGMGTGVVGVTVAPLAAVLRLSTSLTSSIATQANTLGTIVKPMGRARFPRQIRARCQIEAYNEALARAQVVLRLCPGELNGNLIYFTEISDTAAVLLTEKHLIHVESGEIEGSLALHKIDRMEVRAANRCFYLFLVSDHSPMRIRSESFQLLARLYFALEAIHGCTVNSSLV